MKKLTRRKFLKILGLGTVALPVVAKAVEVTTKSKPLDYKEVAELVNKKKLIVGRFNPMREDEKIGTVFHDLKTQVRYIKISNGWMKIPDNDIFMMPPPPDIDNDYIRWQNEIRRVMNEATGLK